jgi:hypothetical protein
VISKIINKIVQYALKLIIGTGIDKLSDSSYEIFNVPNLANIRIRHPHPQKGLSKVINKIMHKSIQHVLKLIIGTGIDKWSDSIAMFLTSRDHDDQSSYDL